MENAANFRTLTAKQSWFVNEYMVDMNGAAAALRCGYSKKTSRAIAYELLTKPNIQAALQARQAVMSKVLKINRQGIIKGLLEAADMGRDQQNPGAMVGALREISKLLGFYAPEVKKVELTAPQNGTYRNLVSWTDAELLDAIAAGKAVA